MSASRQVLSGGQDDAELEDEYKHGRSGFTPMNTSRPRALVTGASGGIGYELAKVLAREGNDLVLVARSTEQLEKIAADLREDFGVDVRVLPADLSEPGAPDRIQERLVADGLGVDILVNNAGFGTLGPFASRDTASQVDMVQVNVAALTHLSHLFIGPMVERGRGRIMNVASTAAFQPGPGMAVYFSTKAYVLSFSEALAEELRGSGVTVTTLCPGPTVTGFQKRAGMERSALGGRMVTASAASVARAGYRGMMRGRRVVIPGWTNRVGTVLPRLFPRALATRIVARLTAARERS